jgi:hypothetical protein
MKKSNIFILFWTLLPVFNCFAQNLPVADRNFDTSVEKPAHTKQNPKVLFDEAHRNLHTTGGLFKPFADLIENDGYRVTPNNEKFSAEVLEDYEILVISNARANRPGESAFTDAECDAVAAWVKAGGALLLIADHAPLGGFAEKLSQRFGVGMSNAYTDDPEHLDPELRQILFSRENGLLFKHPITEGRKKAERIERVVSFTGQSLSVPKDAKVILKLSDTAYDSFPNTDKPNVPAKGRAQMLSLKFGKGRVVISGEAAMLSAQTMANGFRFGMNASAEIDNRQLVLNIMHWLSGLLK